MTGAPTCRREIGESFALYVLRSIVFSPLRLVLKSHAVEGGLRLSKQSLSGSIVERSLTARNSAEHSVASVI